MSESERGSPRAPSSASDDALPRVVIHKLSTGVPGLDEVLGGGIPEYSFNLLAGAPGTGKTTLAQQILFAVATPERPGLFFTVLGEPAVKMLRYQQQFSFFDPARVGNDVRFLNLSDEVLTQDLESVLDRITAEVERSNPGIVIVDSFRTVIRAADGSTVGELTLQHFVQRLALRLTSWEATTFLIGEFADGESRDPVFTVADGVIWLMNEVERNTSVRKLRVTKVRGQAPQPGLHSVRMSRAGVEVFPRQAAMPARPAVPQQRHRLSTGVAELDTMIGGGIPAGDSILVTGPTGSGKTILGTQFVAEGARKGECAVIAVFEEHPRAYVERAKNLGFDLDAMIAAGTLDILYLRPLDLSVDETLHEIQEAVAKTKARRVVIDSLTGLEIALAPTFEQDFRESLYRLIGALTGVGITILMTVEVTDSFTELRFSPHEVSFMTNDIVLQRYVEIESQLCRVMTVIKTRSRKHSSDLRSYEITSQGIAVGESFKDYRGIISGVPQLRQEKP